MALCDVIWTPYDWLNKFYCFYMWLSEQKPAMLAYKLKLILFPQVIAIINNYACSLANVNWSASPEWWSVMISDDQLIFSTVMIYDGWHQVVLRLVASTSVNICGLLKNWCIMNVVGALLVLVTHAATQVVYCHYMLTPCVECLWYVKFWHLCLKQEDQLIE